MVKTESSGLVGRERQGGLKRISVSGQCQRTSGAARTHQGHDASQYHIYEAEPPQIAQQGHRQEKPPRRPASGEARERHLICPSGQCQRTSGGARTEQCRDVAVTSVSGPKSTDKSRPPTAPQAARRGSDISSNLRRPPEKAPPPIRPIAA